MSIEQARARYTGSDGKKRLNCAQAVLAAFQEQLGIDEETISAMAQCGGGRAPNGRCGAFHAATTILEKRAPELLEQCEQAFISEAGSASCREIRSNRRFSCLQCVEKGAEFLQLTLKEKP